MRSVRFALICTIGLGLVQVACAQDGYQPDGALGALLEGRARANQETLMQQQILLNQQQMLNEVDRKMTERCISYGAYPGTDAFKECRKDQARKLLEAIQGASR